MRRISTIVCLLILAALLIGQQSGAAVKYVKPTGSDSYNGSSWTLAKKSITAALSAAASGDEIWVAAGTYTAAITLKSGVALYGGFSGTETARDQRDIAANRAVLTNAAGSSFTIVNIAFNALSTTRLDGFVVIGTSASPSTAAIAVSGSPTIINSTITGKGLGISCQGSSAMIANNIIRGNASGGGIYCTNSTDKIIGNVIIANSTTNSGRAGGIYCSSGAQFIANNTICANGGGVYAGGIGLSNSSAVIENNIICHNSSGILNEGTSGKPSIRYNCVFDNRAYAYSGFAATPESADGNIASDPMLEGAAYGGWHLSPSSPCRNAGDNGVVQSGSLDRDGQQRIQDGTVDIGADESDGQPHPINPVIIRVAADGNDANDGSTWQLARKNISGAVDLVASSGGEVWIKAGAYIQVPAIQLAPYVSLYGGFSGTETDRSQRGKNQYGSLLTGYSGSATISIANEVGDFSTVDGLTFRGGSTGVSVQNASPTISGNRFVYCVTGISCTSSSARITENAICGSSTPILCSGGAPRISRNRIVGNQGPIQCQINTKAIIDGNVIGSNYNSACGGINIVSCSPMITNNTLLANSTAAIAISEASPACVISNNIVSFGDSGIVLQSGPLPALRSNCVFGNKVNYGGLDDPTGSNGNISQDPLLVNPDFGDAHIRPDSPCRNAGDGSLAQSDLDLDGESRIQDASMDIGADEYNGDPFPGMAAIVHVSPLGNDANDGSSWELSKKTVQSGIDQACLQGGEVWVQEGTYTECIILRPFAHVYGGFEGNEVSRTARNYHAYRTILDGNHLRSTVATIACSTYATIDGFTIRGAGQFDPDGQSGWGNNIYCINASPRIRNNLICGAYGDGIQLSNSDALIANNVITENFAQFGAGIEFGRDSRGHPTIINNTIVGNGYSEGSAIACGSSPDFTIANNIIAFNTGGINQGTAKGIISHNCVYGNSAYDYYTPIWDQTGTYGNISRDPGFASLAYGDLHIQPESPCRNTGDSSYCQADSLDIDGEPRTFDGKADIGADESDGMIHTYTPAIVYVSTTGNNANGGTSWQDAKKTIQAGIDLASALRGEVWVATGTYSESITLAPYAHVFGGFKGTETDRLQRDFRANPTEIHMDPNSSAILFGHYTTTLDGFALRQGRGIICGCSAPTISNCHIADLALGIVSTNSSPRILSCLIERCSSNAITCSHSSDLVISGNVITANQGSAISDACARLTAVGNTIVANGGIGIASSVKPSIIANNLIAFNATGLTSNSHYGSPSVLCNNCIYGNSSDIVGMMSPIGTNGNISQDPKLASLGLGDWHIQPDSPCRNMGDNRNISGDGKDIDGQARIQDGSVDIGADESDGTEWTVNPTIIYVAPEGDNGNDGLSWAKPKKTVQAGIDTASALHGEIWVKAGTYHESIKLTSYAYLYGGFAGNENERGQCNPVANPTMLVAEYGHTVTIGGGHGVNRIDGFHIQGAELEESQIGICCYAGTTIANNVIRDNTGGISVYDSSPVIANNLIIANKGLSEGSSGECSGISLRNSYAMILNNTIIGNCGKLGTGGGIDCVGGMPAIINNLVCYNSSGIHASSGAAPVLHNNCVYGNDEFDYMGLANPTGLDGNISVDPRLVSTEYGDAHLQPDSPCRNAGDPGVAPAGDRDVDWQPRMMDGRVDIGVDQSDDVKRDATPKIVRVRPGGNDTRNGSSWALAKRTIMAAIKEVKQTGGEVWVAEGVYPETVHIAQYTYLYGGFGGNETQRSQRDLMRFGSIIDGAGQQNDCVRFDTGASFSTLDGFIVANAMGGPTGAICCPHATAVIANNSITASDCGIYCSDGAYPAILDNSIADNLSSGGICCDGSSATIIGNQITGNVGGAITISSANGLKPSIITANSVQFNTASNGAIQTNGNAIIANNLVTDNTGIGIKHTGTEGRIIGNTVVSNSGSGIAAQSPTVVLANNISASNKGYGILYSGGGRPNRWSNCLYGNAHDTVCDADMIGVDPLFVDAAGHDYHLRQSSPCVDAGSDKDIEPDWTDIDGQHRLMGAHVDIGADEYFAFGVTCNRSAGLWYGDGSFTFRDNESFAGMVKSYRYVWNRDATYTWSGSEALEWKQASLGLTAEQQGAWYLHLKAFNSEGQPIGAIDQGPYQYGLRSAWAFETKGSAQSGGSIADGIAYFGSTDGCLYALKIADGSKEWALYTGSPIRSRIMVAGDNLYFTTIDGYLHSVSRATHKENWRTTVGGSGLTSTPAANDSYVYVGSNDGYLHKLRVADGTEATKQHIGIMSSCPSVPPISGGGMVVVGTDRGDTYGIRDCDGGFTVAWSYGIVTSGSAKGSPVSSITTGITVIGTGQGAMQYDIASGNVPSGWLSAPLDSSVSVAPWMDTWGGVIYAGTKGGRIYAVRVADGTIQPGYPISFGATASVTGAPLKMLGVSGGDFLYFGMSDCLYAVRADDPTDLLGFTGTGFGPASASGATADDRLIVGSSDGNIYAFYMR